MIGKTIKFLFKTILWVVAIILIIPIGYFALRMGQPMDLPEYKGLTYYQYLEWQQIEQDKHWRETGEAYKKSHPASGLSAKTCNGISLATVHAGLFISQAPRIVLDSILGGESFDTSHFFPNWWALFEAEHVGQLRGNENRHPACRISGEIPDEYALSVGVQLSEETLSEETLP